MFSSGEEDASVFRSGDNDDNGRARDADKEHHLHQKLAEEGESHCKSVTRRPDAGEGISQALKRRRGSKKTDGRLRLA